MPLRQTAGKYYSKIVDNFCHIKSGNACVSFLKSAMHVFVCFCLIWVAYACVYTRKICRNYFVIVVDAAHLHKCHPRIIKCVEFECPPNHMNVRHFNWIYNIVLQMKKTETAILCVCLLGVSPCLRFSFLSWTFRAGVWNCWFHWTATQQTIG